jgi:hypothetical protein
MFVCRKVISLVRLILQIVQATLWLELGVDQVSPCTNNFAKISFRMHMVLMWAAVLRAESMYSQRASFQDKLGVDLPPAKRLGAMLQMCISATNSQLIE